MGNQTEKETTYFRQLEMECLGAGYYCEYCAQMTPKNMIIAGGGVAGGLIAIWALWTQLGGAVPASKYFVAEEDKKIKQSMTRSFRKIESSSKTQTLESAKWGRKIYNKELHDLLIVPPPDNLEQRQYWKESVEDARRWRKFYSDKEIELRKR